MKSSYHMKRKAADRLWKLAYQKRYDDTEPLLAEGTKVKLDVDQILSTKQRRHLSQKYIDFVNTHKDDVFTVEYESRFGDEPSIVLLKEDDTDPKWLWWVGELIAV